MRAGLDERDVAERLAACADTLPVPPARWEDVERGLRRVRRRRRLRRLGTTAGALVCVLGLAGGVQLGAVPYPTWAPAVVLPAAGGSSALAAQPTKGSLKDDDAWLAAFRRHVASDRWDESGGESWSVGNPDDVHVIFAGDVAGHRLALVAAPYRWGLIESPQQVSFVGPAGAEPADMWQGSNSSTSDVAVIHMTPGMGDDTSTAVVVVTADDRPVTLLGAPVYDADGVATRPEQSLDEVEPGVHVWTAPGDAGAIDVRADGRQIAGGAGGGPVSVVVPEPLRGSALPPDVARSGIEQAYMVSGLAEGSAEPLVVWSGAAESRHSAVVALRVESGALVMVLAHQAEGPNGPETYLSVDHATVLPAQPVAGVALAWRQSQMVWERSSEDSGSTAAAGGAVSYAQDGEAEYSGDARSSAWVGLLGPTPAVSAQVLGADGAALTTVPLHDGGAAVKAPDATTIRFLDADGAEVARTDVLPLDDDGGYRPLWER
jgi:hypothetical protein